jgi:putative nucleotidyltransferase with HDIG domain
VSSIHGNGRKFYKGVEVSLKSMDDDKLKLVKDRLRDAFSDYYELAGGKEFRYHHHISVHSYALELMSRPEIEAQNFDREVVELAALFHDIGRAEDIEDGRMSPFEGHEGHGERGAEKVEDFIGDIVESSTLEHVETIIQNHVDTKPQSIEGKIVQDADLLFKFGVHDTWRMFHYASEKDEDIEEKIDYFYERKIPKLKKELEEFHFEITREIAEERLNKLKKVMKSFERHLRGEDISAY